MSNLLEQEVFLALTGHHTGNANEGMLDVPIRG